MPLSVAHGPEAWIDDFVHSTAPQFQGKSKKKRIQMALAAFYAKKRESALLINAHTLLELGMPDQSKPPQSNYVTGGTKTNPGMASPSMSTQAFQTTPAMSAAISQPPLDIGGTLTPTVSPTPSSMVTRSADLMGSQAPLASPPINFNSPSNLNPTPKTLDNVLGKAPKMDSLSILERIVAEAHWAKDLPHDVRRRLHSAAADIHAGRLSSKAAVDSFESAGLPLDTVAHFLRNRVSYLKHGGKH